MNASVKSVLSRRLSTRTIALMAVLTTGVLFLPYLQSLATWARNRNIAFEDGSVALPARWTSGEKGHLLSIRRLGITLLFPTESTITIDPFAERWPADKVESVSEFWLRSHGSPVFNGRFKDPLSRKAITFPSELTCASPVEDAKLEYVRIDCLSRGSIHAFEFFGRQDAIEAFARVSSEAAEIISKHPRSIFRKKTADPDQSRTRNSVLVE